ncbi:MAG: hypothetical protein Q8N37_01615 [bacterium]|nr:hypothetical protein [bacterium]
MIIGGKEEERKKTIKKFEEDNPGFKVIPGKKGGLVPNVLATEDVQKLFESYPPKTSKFLTITVMPGSNPGTEQVVPIAWTSNSGKRHEFLASLVFINNAGKAIGKPGIIALPH